MLGRVAGRMLTTAALLCATLAWSGWVFLHTIGDPHRVERIAEAVLDDDAATAQISATLTEQIVSAVGLSPSNEALVAASVAKALQDPAVSEDLIGAIGAAQANALGVDDPRSTAIDVAGLMAATTGYVAAVDPELAASIPVGSISEVTLPRVQPPGVGALRDLADRTTGVLAGLAVVLLAASFQFGDRRHTVRRFGVWGILSGLGWMVLPLLAVAAARQWAPDQATILSVVVRSSGAAVLPAATGLVVVGIAAVAISLIPAWFPDRRPDGPGLPGRLPRNIVRTWQPQASQPPRAPHAPSPAGSGVAGGSVGGGVGGGVGVGGGGGGGVGSVTGRAPVDTFVRSATEDQPVRSFTPQAPHRSDPVDELDPWAQYFPDAERPRP